MHTALFSTIGRFKTSPYHPTSAQISWKGDEKVVTGYSVQVEGPDSTQVIPRRINTYVDILKLRPSTQYFFSVSAVTVAGTTPQRGKSSMLCDHYQCACTTLLGCPSMSIIQCYVHAIHTPMHI